MTTVALQFAKLPLGKPWVVFLHVLQHWSCSQGLASPICPKVGRHRVSLAGGFPLKHFGLFGGMKAGTTVLRTWWFNT